MNPYFIICAILISLLGHAQGCSDAGFCTMGAMRPNQKYNRNLNLKIRAIEYTSYFGVADFKFKNTKIYDYFLSQILDANIGLSSKSTVQIKLPINTTIGNITNVTGLSDLSISGTKTLKTTRNWNFNGSIGFKIPLGKPNHIAPNGKPLPMYYQPTLGTFDIIAGFSMSSSKWLFATGYQNPLNNNVNNFTWAPWNKTEDSAKINVYPRSNQLKRGYDVMLRVERNFRFSKWNAYLGLLPIFRLKKDEFLNPKSGKYETMPGTDGLALTLLIGGGYKISNHSGLKLLFGNRIVKRKLNADGLSRLAVTSLSYEYTF